MLFCFKNLAYADPPQEFLSGDAARPMLLLCLPRFVQQSLILCSAEGDPIFPAWASQLQL